MNQVLIVLLLVASALGGGHSLVSHHDHVDGNTLSAMMVEAGAAAGGHHTGVPQADHGAPADDGSAPPAHEHSDDCALGHAHCCAPAILSSCELALGAKPQPSQLPPAGVIPYGQQSHPPHRPPRAAA